MKKVDLKTFADSGASGLPPCEAEVMCHLKRVAFVARMWADADQSQLAQHPSVEDGWTLDDGI